MKRPGRRPGFALIECLVLITVMAVLIGLSAGTIQLLLRLDGAGRAASDEAVSLARLARDFRDDAHESTAVDPPGRSADRLLLPLGDSRVVEYAVRPVDILRTVRRGEKIIGFETYRKPSRASARIVVAGDGPRPIAAIIIDRPSGDRDIAPYREYRIEAELGKHGRLKASRE